MSPAETIIQKFGGPAEVAKAAGVDVSNVHRWRYPKERGGTGGLVPQRHHQTLLMKAREFGFSLEPADFFPAEPTTKGAA